MQEKSYRFVRYLNTNSMLDQSVTARKVGSGGQHF